MAPSPGRRAYQHFVIAVSLGLLYFCSGGKVVSKVLFLRFVMFCREISPEKRRNAHCLRSWVAVLGRLQQNVRVDYNVIKITFWEWL